MKIKNYLFLLVTALFVLNANAQNNTSSPYSIRGFGEIEQFQTAYSKSLGGAINGIRSPRSLSFSNPASYGSINHVLLDFGFRADFSKVYSENAAKTKYNGNFNYISLAFPIYRKPVVKKDTSAKTNDKTYRDYQTVWSGGFGLIPYSNISAAYTKEKDTTYGTIINSYSRTGGLNRLFFTNAVNLNKNYSVGLNASYIFGQSRLLDGYFLSDSFVSRATIQENNTRYSGFKFDLGFQGQKETTITTRDSVSENGKTFEVIKKRPLRFVFGATLNNNGQLDYSIYRKITNKSSFNPFAAVDTILLQENKKGNTSLPLGYSVGFSLTYNTNWMLTADYRTDRWGSMKNSLFTDSFNNSSQFNIGFAFRPDIELDEFATKDNDKKNRSKFEYRIGFRTLNTGYYFKDNAGNINPLKEYGISFGIGLPMRKIDYNPKRIVVKSMVNITGEYIHRGNTNNGMLAENLYRLTISYTLSDIWFKKRKFY